MQFVEKWIWLPADKYPKFQLTDYSAFENNHEESYCVAEFQKKYAFDQKVVRAHLRFCGDTEFRLCLNDKLLATGPVTVEGDFLGNNRPRNNFYATELEISPDTDVLMFYARVKMKPVRICEYSKGHGGFMLSAHITYEDGTKAVICTDKSWQVRYNGAYTAPFMYDDQIQPDPFVSAAEIDNIWNAETAPVSVRTEEELFPTKNPVFTVPANTETETEMEFDKIYAGFLRLQVKTAGKLELKVELKETDTGRKGITETLVFCGNTEYVGLQLHSVGKLTLCAKAERDAQVTVSIVATCYPVLQTAKTLTSDQDLNRVLEVCAHTLQYCRQLHHLDSPLHCEPLACTGDYYIESLMTAFSFGDQSLAAFDVLRTAQLIRNNHGRMFHTTYSLIWVRMLYDVYMLTGNKHLLTECEDALLMLLSRFQSYLGENGIIETPPDFMFVDWIYIDGHSMHHPPKALGQTCLNMFYFGALDAASSIFRILSENAMAEKCLCQKEALKNAINRILYDEEKGLYFEGLNTKTPAHLLGQYMPQNTEKRYYLKHSNILAAYFGVCDDDTAKDLLHKIMNDTCPGIYQPYFAHFLLEAIEKHGLREAYTLSVLENWKAPVAECSKGLAEGFYPPEPTYVFDHSHAWGGTPLYSLPKALLGLRIEKPGLSEISLSPSLLSLDFATVELPTPYGMVICKMKKGASPVVTAPEGVIVHIRTPLEDF